MSARGGDAADSAQRHIDRANVAADIGRLSLVEREARAALSHDPRAVRAHELLAWTFMEQRRYREALEAANDGLAVRSDRAHLHYIAAVVLHRQGVLVAARIRAEAALRLAPRSALYHVRLARLALDEKEPARARELADKALALAPEDGFVLGEAAYVFGEAGDSARALSVAEQRVRLAPDDVWALAGLARAQSWSRLHQDVVATCRRVVARDPNILWVWALYAEALDAIGEYAAADEAAEVTLRLAPNTTLGGVATARVLCARREWKRAEQVARLVLQKQPGNPRASALLDRARRLGVPLRRF